MQMELRCFKYIDIIYALLFCVLGRRASSGETVGCIRSFELSLVTIATSDLIYDKRKQFDKKECYVILA